MMSETMDFPFDLSRRTWLAWMCASAASAASPSRAQGVAPVLAPGELTEFRVELPAELRELAGHRGTPTTVKQVLVSVAAPPNFDAAREWPVLVVNATSDPGYNSSRQLLLAYRAAAASAGWVIVAADPEPAVSQTDDQLMLRFALDLAALVALRLHWKDAGRAPLAFAGFSGGAKYSGYLAALFRRQGARLAGVYMAGVNQNALGDAARHFGVLDDTLREVPVFLQAGSRDRVATPVQHRAIESELARDGFRHVRLEFVPGGHALDPAPLAEALRWFDEGRRNAAAPAGPSASGVVQ
jgi:predicted esterase